MIAKQSGKYTTYTIMNKFLLNILIFCSFFYVTQVAAIEPPRIPVVSRVVATIRESDEIDIAELYQLHNDARKKIGLKELGINLKLRAAAMSHAKNMANGSVPFSHAGLSSRVSKHGYAYSYIGENIAWGQNSSKHVFNTWMNSHGHYLNIVNRNFTEYGIGYAADSRGRIYWCVIFGRPSI